MGTRTERKSTLSNFVKARLFQCIWVKLTFLKTLFYRKAIEKHRDQSNIHKAIIRKLKSTREVLEEDLTSFVNPDEELYPETSRVLRMIYHGVQSLFLSFKALARMVALFVYHHVEIGLGCRSDKIHTDMAHSLGLSFHDRLVNHVQTMETPCALVLGNDANISCINELFRKLSASFQN